MGGQTQRRGADQRSAPSQDLAVRAAFLLSSDRSGVGPCHDQNVRLSALWCAGDLERSRMGGTASPAPAGHNGQGRQLLHRGQQFFGIGRLAAELDRVGTIARLRQLCERWIYSTCLCFALSHEDRKRSGFAYQYSVFQLELSRNLLFLRGTTMDEVYQKLIDRTRASLSLEQVKSIFGFSHRPHR